MSQQFPQPKAISQSAQLLARYSQALVERPIRTKAITSGTLLADYLSGTTPRTKKTGNPIVDTLSKYKRAIQFAIYGAFINAPVSHYLVDWLQKVTAGQVGLKGKLIQIFLANTVVLPVVLIGYIGSTAVVAGSRNINTIISAIKQNFWRAYRVSAVTNPLSVIFAQRFISPVFWTTFFAAVSFVRGTQINAQAKKSAALARARSNPDA